MRMRPVWILGMRVALIGGIATCALAREMPEGLLACVAEPDAMRRLACYDREMAPVVRDRAAVNSPPAGASGTTPEDQFGVAGELERKRHEQNPPAELRQLTSRVVSVSRKARGELVIRLENGQVWEQSHEEDRFSVAAGETVTLRKGALGSFWLDSAGGQSLRVRRTQ